MCMDELDAVSIWRWTQARKDHECDACRETIEDGDLYMVYRGLHEGVWESTKQCARCHAIWSFLRRSCPGEPIDVRLDCGETWEGPEADHAYALWTRDEGQAYARDQAGREP